MDMAEQEKIRINKVLKEFSIGLGTLVEFLSKKGYEVESNPGAQISGEEYELVRKEYAKEQLIREESRKIAIKVKEITREEQFGNEVFSKAIATDNHSAPGSVNMDKKKVGMSFSAEDQSVDEHSMHKTAITRNNGVSCASFGLTEKINQFWEQQNKKYRGDKVVESDEGQDVLPLFVRYDKNKTKSFDEEMISSLAGIHQCYFIHRREKRRTKTYEELAIKFEDLPICMTAQRAKTNDEITLSAPRFTEKNMVLPEEGQFIARKCDVKFVDLCEDSFKLVSETGTYWLNHREELAQFIADCFSLPIPPIEIQIEEDKEMWQAYLDGLNAILENKRDLIRVLSVGKLKGDQLRLNFDMESYVQNLKNAIFEELNGKCDQKPQISIKDRECLISFDSYQTIPEDTIDNIKNIGRDYCYTAEATPVNTVSGAISIVSNQDEMNDIIASIYKELVEGFEEVVKKDANGEFHLSNDKSMEILNKIVDTYYSEIAIVVNTTKIVMPLLPAEDSIDIGILKGNLPDYTQIKQYGKYFVVSSRLPLDVSLDIFRNMRFLRCVVNIALKEVDPDIQIEGTTIKGSAYTRIVDDFSELSTVGRFFYEVRKRYQDRQFVNSAYNYEFAAQVNKSALIDLKSKHYGKPSMAIDVPRSCVYFTTKSKEDYDSIKDAFLEQLDSSIEATAPEYNPTAKIDFLCENKEYRRGVFEKVNVALTDIRKKFIKYELTSDAKCLVFEFSFEDIDERDEIEKILHEALESIHCVKIIYLDGNNKGVTQWRLTEDPSLLQELNNKLRLDFKNESINYINGKEYDMLSEVDEEELNSSRDTKNTIVKRKRQQYLNRHNNLGTCISRGRDYAVIRVNREKMEAMRSNEFRISHGDYIQFPAVGEAIELMRQRVAMNRILKPANKYNQSPINPNLPTFIFDPQYASETIVNIEKVKEDIREHNIGNLNEKQLEAVAKSVLAKDLALVQGPPGTGKTTVIAEIIWQEIRRNPGCRILLTSQTNLAVDNALERLQGQSGIRPVRIGKPGKLEPEGRRFSLPIIDAWTEGREKYYDSEDMAFDTEDNASKMWIDRIVNKVSRDYKYAEAIGAWKKELIEKNKHSRTEFGELYKRNINLVAATCSICGSRDFYLSYADIFGECNHPNEMFFDVVIMDEASKATPLEMAVPLVLGKKIIIIGDHKQLPPMMDENTIDSALEKIGKKDLSERLQNAGSQFKILFETAAEVRKTIVSTLDTQYRMHEQIMNTIKQFYQKELAATGGLKCGIIESMDIPDLKNKSSRWHGITINPIINPETHAVWIDVKTPEKAMNPGFMNEGELESIDLVLKALDQADGYKEFLNAQVKPEDREIGIITFYSAQCREIKKRYKDKTFRVDVVDRFQGMERNIIIVSTVRSNANNNIGFAKEIERINVAFSRAKRLLIVVGNKGQFERNNNYAVSIANMKTVNVGQLKDAVR